jgi:WD40 repeat protein
MIVVLVSPLTAQSNGIELVATLGRGRVVDVHWTPDGDILVVASTTGFWLYEDLTAEPNHISTLEYHRLHSMDISSTGQIAAGFEDGMIVVWEPNWTLAYTLHGHDDPVIDVAFSPDGSLLGSGSYGSVIIWQGQEQQHQFAAPRYTDTGLIEGANAPSTNITFSDDNRYLAVSGVDAYPDSVYLRDAVFDLEIGSYIGRTRYGSFNLAFLPDSHLVVDPSSRIYDVEQTYTDVMDEVFVEAVGDLELPYMTYALIFTEEYVLRADGASFQIWHDGLEGEAQPLTIQPLLHWDDHSYRLSLSLSHHLLAMVTLEGHVRVWHVLEDREVALLTGYNGIIQDVEYGQNMLASADAAYGVILRHTDDYVIAANPLDVAGGAVAFSPDGNWLAYSRTLDVYPVDSVIYLVKRDTNRTISLRTPLRGYQHPMGQLAFSTDSRYLMWMDTEIVMWDVQHYQPLWELERDVYDDQSIMAFHPNGTAVAVSTSYHVEIRDVETGTILVRFNEPGGRFTALAFSPDGTWLAATSVGLGTYNSAGGRLVVWNLQTEAVVHSIETSQLAGYRDIAVHPDGHLLTIGGTNGELYFYDTASWELLATVPTSMGQIYALDFSTDGRQLAVGLDSGVIQIYQLPE